MFKDVVCLKYIVLLRGVNISGKNKVSMSELKKELIRVGYSEVRTYLNSGNVILESNLDKDKIVSDMTSIIKDKFKVSVPIFIMEFSKLADALNNSPSWWGTNSKEIYDNIIFVIPPSSVSDVCDVLGNPSIDIEKIHVYDSVIFWSFKLESYRKANWWIKTASTDIRDNITIRTANTMKKLLEMGREL